MPVQSQEDLRWAPEEVHRDCNRAGRDCCHAHGTGEHRRHTVVYQKAHHTGGAGHCVMCRLNENKVPFQYVIAVDESMK